MNFDVLTLFPELFGPFCEVGVLGRAVSQGTVAIAVHDLRQWTTNRWHSIDDEPYGGGAGMVLQAPPLLAAMRAIGDCEPAARTILLTPGGRSLDHGLVRELAGEARLILVCGRYEGIDQRVAEILKPEEISVGDFVLGGGEVAAMAVIEAVARLVPGVVGDPESVASDSFASGLLDFPCYTRPAVVEGCEVPPVLLSGHHEAIRRWRLEQSVELSVSRRPDLVDRNWDSYPEEVRELIMRARNPAEPH